MAVLREILTDWTTAAGTGFVTVMYFEQPIAVADQRLALDNFWQSCTAGLSNQTGYTIRTSGNEIEDTTGGLVDVWSDSTLYGDVGSFAGEPVPDASQALVRWRCAAIVGGRFLQGRTFIPGMASATVDNGNLSSASRTPIQTGANAFIASAAGLTVWHRPTAGAGGSHDAVSTAVVNEEFAVLRRRRK